MHQDIASIRKDYILQTLEEKDAEKNPMNQFEKWWKAAIESDIDEVNAMTLVTVGENAKPSARIVLLKDVEPEGFVFFTNYQSNKGHQIEHNNQVALLFFWKELERQVRIEGIVEKISEEKSQQYFSSRPVGSQIGAWASPQSKIISSRKILDDNVEKFTNEFKGKNIPKPPHWGGYIVKPNKIEFWQGRSSRLHDRLCYHTTESDHWAIERLAP